VTARVSSTASDALVVDAGGAIEIAPRDPVGALLWREVGRLAGEILPLGWALVSGLMVQLHAYEAGELGVRTTTDIDILGDARGRGGLSAIVRALLEDDFVLDVPSAGDRIGHRWRRGELVVDLLAPDGLRRDPSVSGQIRTLQIPGGSQALVRAEEVAVVIEGVRATVRRPTLLGALLLKARAIRVHADPDAQRADLVLLRSLIQDPGTAAAELKPAERKWLRDSADVLGLGDPVRMASFAALGERSWPSLGSLRRSRDDRRSSSASPDPGKSRPNHSTFPHPQILALFLASF